MNWFIKLCQGASYQVLMSLRSDIVKAAQKIYNEWNVEHDEYGDVEFGFGGICDAVSREIEHIISTQTDFLTAEGGTEGSDHSFVIVKTPEGYYTIDIPCYLYESGAGYKWNKIPDVVFSADHVYIDYLGDEDYYWPGELDELD